MHEDEDSKPFPPQAKSCTMGRRYTSEMLRNALETSVPTRFAAVLPQRQYSGFRAETRTTHVARPVDTLIAVGTSRSTIWSRIADRNAMASQNSAPASLTRPCSAQGSRPEFGVTATRRRATKILERLSRRNTPVRVRRQIAIRFGRSAAICPKSSAGSRFKARATAQNSRISRR